MSIQCASGDCAGSWGSFHTKPAASQDRLGSVRQPTEPESVWQAGKGKIPLTAGRPTPVAPMSAEKGQPTGTWPRAVGCLDVETKHWYLSSLHSPNTVARELAR